MLTVMQEAYARRGAPWTFDGRAFVEAIRRIKQQGKAMLPSFDHGVGDPIEDDILIDTQQHSVVLVSAAHLVYSRICWCPAHGCSTAQISGNHYRVLLGRGCHEQSALLIACWAVTDM